MCSMIGCIVKKKLFSMILMVNIGYMPSHISSINCKMVKGQLSVQNYKKSILLEWFF